jgi:alpha-beta hydrolase superfamily lysophospholipase
MEKIIFNSKDGLKIEGEIFQSSDHVVILAHGKAFNMESWEKFAGYLEDNGFSALPFNFRGYGNSESKDLKYELDIIGAIEYASKKYKKISLMGASMGGTASLRALELYTKSIDGLILLSPAGLPKEFMALNSKAKKAMIAFSKGDFVFETAQKISSDLPIPSEKIIFDGTLHAQNLFRDPQISEVLSKRIVEFLRSI